MNSLTCQIVLPLVEPIVDARCAKTKAELA